MTPQRRRRLVDRPAVTSLIAADVSRALGDKAVILPEIDELRQLEATFDEHGTKAQFRFNRLALIYGRQIQIDYTMSDTGFRAFDKEAGIWRRGRPGLLPSKKNLTMPMWGDIYVTPAVADALIERDG